MKLVEISELVDKKLAGALGVWMLENRISEDDK